MPEKWILEVLVVVLVVKLCALALSVSAWLVLQNQPADLLSLWNRWDYVAIARYGHIAVGEQRLFIVFPPLFPLLAISCMYYARTRRWTLAGLTEMLSTATRLTGLALVPALLSELLQQRTSPKSYSSGSLGFLILISCIIRLAVHIFTYYPHPLSSHPFVRLFFILIIL